MGRYLKEARHHPEKIQYYYDHDGSRAYAYVNLMCGAGIARVRSI